jgi:dipeptidyl aminopeptidase/acylaminoacyl peptidase
MTFMAVRDGFPAKAAATFGAFTDFEAYLTSNSRAAKIVDVVWPDYGCRKQEILSSRSTPRWAEKLTVPILLMHGGADRQVSPSQTLNLASLLQQLGKEYGLQIFAGDTHTLSKNAVERDRQAGRWFKQHMQ